MKVGSIKYFRFIEAPHMTYRLEVEQTNSIFYARWSSIRGEYNKEIHAYSKEQATAMALQQMYNHLTMLISGPQSGHGDVNGAHTLAQLQRGDTADPAACTGRHAGIPPVQM